MDSKKVAIVTGGSGGIGRAAALELAARGCTVYELSRTNEHPAEGITHLDCDVTDEAAVSAAVNTVLLSGGRVDLLVCCAGSGISGAVEYTVPEDSHAQLEVNLFGVDRAVRAVLLTMREQQRGRIVIVSSVAAVTPIPFQTWYSVSKAALNAYASALSGEMRPYGITVSVVMPGDIKTGFTAARKKTPFGDGEYTERVQRSVGKMEHDEQNGLSADYAGKIVAKAALSRRARPLRSTGFAYSAVCTLAKILPARLMQWILYSMYAK